MSGDLTFEEKIEQEIIDDEFKVLLDNANELMLYLVINEFGGIIWRLNHDMADGRISQDKHVALDQSIMEMRIKQMIAIKRCKKFGLEKPFQDTEKDKYAPTDEYWKWFRWWDGHIKSLTDAQFSEMDRCLQNNKDVSKFYPSGDWGNKPKVSAPEERIERIINSD